jgi:hypothetical protein
LVHGFSPPAPPRCVFQNRSRRRWRARARKRMEESLAGCGSAAPADQCRCSHANSDGADRASIAHWTVKDLSGRCFDLLCLSSETAPSLQEISTSIGIPRDALKKLSFTRQDHLPDISRFTWWIKSWRASVAARSSASRVSAAARSYSGRPGWTSR